MKTKEAEQKNLRLQIAGYKGRLKQCMQKNERLKEELSRERAFSDGLRQGIQKIAELPW